MALAAIALFCFRPRTHDLTLIYLALFCFLFAVKLLSYLPSFRSLFDESPKFWSYVAWVISSVLIFPGGLFLYQVVGEYFRKFLRWLLTARAVIAVFEILAAAFGVSLARLGVANNISTFGRLFVLRLDGLLISGFPNPLRLQLRVGRVPEQHGVEAAPICNARRSLISNRWNRRAGGMTMGE